MTSTMSLAARICSRVAEENRPAMETFSLRSERLGLRLRLRNWRAKLIRGQSQIVRSAAFMPLRHAHCPEAPKSLTRAGRRTVKRHKCRAPSPSLLQGNFAPFEFFGFGGGRFDQKKAEVVFNPAAREG